MIDGGERVFYNVECNIMVNEGVNLYGCYVDSEFTSYFFSIIR